MTQAVLLVLAIYSAHHARALPQVTRPGEPITEEAVTQVGPVIVTPTTYDAGFYTWQPATSFLIAPATVTPISRTREVPEEEPSTVEEEEDVLTTSSIPSPTSLPMITSSLRMTTSSLPMTSTSTTSASDSETSAAAASESADAQPASTSTSGSRVVMPLLIVGAIILIAFIGALCWTRRRRIRSFIAARRRGRTQDSPDDTESLDRWAEKHSGYDGDRRRASVAWAEEIPFDRDDRYASVSSRLAHSQSVDELGRDGVEGERGWMWGATQPLRIRQPSMGVPDEKELLADHDRLDAMLASSRTGYLPREREEEEMKRRPSMLTRVASSISSLTSQRSRRMAKLSSFTAHEGSAGEFGSWKALPDEEEEDRVSEMAERPLPPTPKTPGRVSAGAFQGDSVRRPLMAATPDTHISRSVKRWQLHDRPMPTDSPSPTASPVRTATAKRKIQAQLPDILRPASPRTFGSPPQSPDAYSTASPGVPMPPAMSQDASTMSLSHIATLIFPSSSQDGHSTTDAFGPYTSLPPARQRTASRKGSARPDRTPTKVARREIDDIVNDAMSRRSASPAPSSSYAATPPRRAGNVSRQKSTGSLTGLVEALLADEDEEK